MSEEKTEADKRKNGTEAITKARENLGLLPRFLNRRKSNMMLVMKSFWSVSPFQKRTRVYNIEGHKDRWFRWRKS